MSAKKAIVLLSGGLDSTTVLAIALAKEYNVYTLSFDYGQRHKQELNSIKKIIKHYKIKNHFDLKIDLRKFGGSALTSNIKVPTHEIKGIPITYVPARNTIFLSYALALADVIKCHDIFIGANVVDYGGYPDCRPKYLKAFEKMANLATKLGTLKNGCQVKIHAPLLYLSKADIIKNGIKLKVPYQLTHSCYAPTSKGYSCGKCNACKIRLKGFKQNKLKDSIYYV